MKQYHKNPRRITKKQYADLERWLRELGDLSGIVHDLNTDEIIGGNQRSRVFDINKCEIELTNGPHEPDEQGTVALGWVIWEGKRYAYRQVRWTPEQCEKANIVANKAGGEWDFDILANQFEMPDLLEWGFSEEELTGLDFGEDSTPEGTEDPGPDTDKACELLEKWKVSFGDLWKIGNHLLLCGDSTSKDDVSKLMGNDKARLIPTSPPYADQRDYGIGDFDWQDLMCGVFGTVIEFCGSNSDILINLGLSHKDGRVNQYWNGWLEYCDSVGWPLYGWYVWDKGSGFPGEWNGRLAPAHEFVFHFSKGHTPANKWIKTTGESVKRGSSGRRFRQKDGSMKEIYSKDKIGQPFKIPDSVIRVGREMARGVHTQVHPAVFSVEFAEFLIRTWSNPGDIILEPFSGSGTTIVACENTGRVARAIDLEPAYVAVTLERLSLMGLTPKLVE